MESLGVYFVVGLLGVRNNRIFRGVERNTNDVWSLVRFYVSSGCW